MHIDIFSAVLFNVTSSFFIGFSLFFVARGHLGQIKGIKRWAGGLFFQCIGWSLLGATKVFPELISLAPLATATLVLSLAFYYQALVEFKDIKLNTKWAYYAVLIDFACLLYFDVVTINVGLRVVITAFFSLVFVAAMSHLLLSKRFNLGEKIPASHKMMGYVFAACAAVLLARIVYFSIFPQQDIFANNVMQSVSYLMFHIVISFSAFGFLLMCSEKYVQLQRETETSLKNSEARYRKIIEILPVPMALYDDNQNVTLVNKVFTQTFGYDLNDISHLNEWWHKAYPDETYRAWVAKEWTEALRSSTGSYSTVSIPQEVVVRCKDGSEKTVLASASTLTTDVDGLYLAVLFDITVRKNQELEMHKAQLAAEALAQSKAEFLANMSHEIRTPMNAIIGFTELALDDDLNDDVRSFLEKIHISSKSLLGILNDILDFSKAESGKLEIVPMRQGNLSTKLNQYSGQLTGAKILLAEDDEINQEVVSRFLKFSGVNLDIASDGFEVLEKLKKCEYDLILMDVNMPNLDGIETTKQIRERAKYQALPIVALTAGVTYDEQTNCRKSGMNDFVKKPINPEELVGVLCRYIDVKN